MPTKWNKSLLRGGVSLPDTFNDLPAILETTLHLFKALLVCRIGIREGTVGYQTVICASATNVDAVRSLCIDTTMMYSRLRLIVCFMTLLHRSVTVVATESSPDDDDSFETTPNSLRTRGGYYFGSEIDFLVRQSMKMSGYDASTNDVRDERTRLKLTEQLLQRELDYVRQLKKKKTEISSNRYHRPFQRLWRILVATISNATWSEMASFAMENNIKRNWIEMHDYYDCEAQALQPNQPMYTPEKWSYLWQAFQNASVTPYPLSKIEFGPSYYAAYSEGKGRGLFASRNITKGELVHSGYPNTAFFLDATSWYRFIVLLPKDMKCDVLEWAWLQDLTNSGNLVLCLNMDIAVFFNHGGEEGSNMQKKERTSLDFYAIEDIVMNDEILYNYGSDDFLESLADFGL